MARLARPFPWWTLAALIGWLVTGAALAAPLAPADVPEPLKPWVPWVLHDVEGAGCPHMYASGERR